MVIYTLRRLTQSAASSAICAEPAKNQFAFANNALAQGACSRPGHVVPIDVLYVATVVADEMVVPHAFRIESRGAAFDSHFAHQASVHEISQVVIRGGSR